jgi:hypothetical protein
LTDRLGTPGGKEDGIDENISIRIGPHEAIKEIERRRDRKMRDLLKSGASDDHENHYRMVSKSGKP